MVRSGYYRNQFDSWYRLLKADDTTSSTPRISPAERFEWRFPNPSCLGTFPNRCRCPEILLWVRFPAWSSTGTTPAPPRNPDTFAPVSDRTAPGKREDYRFYPYSAVMVWALCLTVLQQVWLPTGWLHPYRFRCLYDYDIGTQSTDFFQCLKYGDQVSGSYSQRIQCLSYFPYAGGFLDDGQTSALLRYRNTILGR